MKCEKSNEGLIVAIKNLFSNESSGRPLHEKCQVLQITENGELENMGNNFLTTFKSCNIQFFNTWILSSCACTEIEFDSSSQECSRQVGYIILLWLPVSMSWTVISVVLTPLSRNSSISITSEDMQGPITACWDRYCLANRLCDGLAMSKVFHPLCRLTYSTHNPETDEEGVIILTCSEFCHMVSNRYNEEPHSQFAPYQKDLNVVAIGDTMQGVSMIAPNIALVRLKIGHPPYLWRDFLVCAKLGPSNHDWWIVAKSSSSEPHQANSIIMA
jgi:hypothetical protein